MVSYIDVPVTRSRGARGAVGIPYRTIEGTAKEDADYEPVEGVLEFTDEVVDMMRTVTTCSRR